MSWRDVQRVSANGELAPPTGDNVRKQASYALNVLLKIFGGDEARASDFISKKLKVPHPNDTFLLNSVVGNIDNLSSKMSPWKNYNVTNVKIRNIVLVLPHASVSITCCFWNDIFTRSLVVYTSPEGTCGTKFELENKL